MENVYAHFKILLKDFFCVDRHHKGVVLHDSLQRDGFKVAGSLMSPSHSGSVVIATSA